MTTAKHSGGVLNVTKVTIISHLIRISYIELFPCKDETSLFKSDARFRAVSELEKTAAVIQALFAGFVCWASCALSFTSMEIL